MNAYYLIRTLVRLVLFLSFVSTFTIVPSLYAASIKLSIPDPIGNRIEQIQISPDSQSVVYTADHEINRTLELYQVPVIGGPLTKLNPPLSSGGTISKFAISPDGQSVIYRADQDTYQMFELYAVPFTGGTPIKLNPPLDRNQDVVDFAISSDSSTVVYTTNTDSIRELYTVPLTGGTAIKLNPSDNRHNVFEFAISPDNSTVVYTANTGNVWELYAVPLTGGTAIKLNPPLSSGGFVRNFAISPDSSTVVYNGAQESRAILELYAVPLTGGSPIKLNAPFESGINIFEFAISPDSTTVVYSGAQATTGAFELYAVAIYGGTSTQLTTPVFDNSDLNNRFTISPDSTTVVYNGAQESRAILELYSVPITGGTIIQLNAPDDGGVSGFTRINHIISPDSSTVVYLATQEVNEVYELFQVPLTGGIPIKLNPPLAGDRDVTDFAIVAENSWVVYSADQDTNGVEELYVADDDTATVGFAMPATSVAENAGTTTIAVVLDAPALTPVTVDYTVTGGTATNGTDFILPEGQLTIPPGKPGGTITVPILEDDQVEGDKTVEITLRNPTNATLENASFTLTIEENDTTTVGFATDTATVTEDDQSTEVPIALDAPSVKPVTVDYAVTGGTATNGDDYILDDGQLSIPSGQTEGTLTITLVEDNQIESDETIEITLSNPTNATLEGATFTLTIEDTTADGPDNIAIYLPLLTR